MLIILKLTPKGRQAFADHIDAMAAVSAAYAPRHNADAGTKVEVPEAA